MNWNTSEMFSFTDAKEEEKEEVEKVYKLCCWIGLKVIAFYSSLLV
jgi:hypothetical protein